MVLTAKDAKDAKESELMQGGWSEAKRTERTVERRRSMRMAKPIKQRGKRQTPKTLHGELRATQNRAAAQQTRKILARHYAAKYRVQKGR